MPEEKVENVEKEPQENEIKKKSKFKLILIIICAVFCLGIGGAYFLYGDAIMGKFFKKNTGETEKKAEKSVGPIMSLEPFLFNIAGNNTRFAKISIGIEMRDVKSMEEAKKMTLLIRDKILSVLGSKSMDVLMDVGSRDAIKKEIHGTLSSLFKKPEDINAIYITDIIIQ